MSGAATLLVVHEAASTPTSLPEVRADLVRLADELTTTLGLPPRLRFIGAVAAAVEARTAEARVAVAR